MRATGTVWLWVAALALAVGVLAMSQAGFAAGPPGSGASCVTVCERYGRCPAGAAWLCCKAWAVQCNGQKPRRRVG